MAADGTQIRPGGVPEARRPEIALAELAEAQYGVVSLGQLRGLGLTVRAVDKRVAAGRLHRIYRDVFAVGHRYLTVHGNWMAAVLACGKGAILSHRSAAALWGVLDDGRPVIDVRAPNRRGRHRDRIVAHRYGSLAAIDVTRVAGIPCTSLARTLLDVAASQPFRRLRHAVTQSEVEGLLDLEAVRDVRSRNRGARGVARLELAVSDHDPRGGSARPGLERRFLAFCRRSELPAPEVNGSLLVDGVLLMPDFIWRDAGLIVEADGRRFHDTAVAFEEDRRRDQLLAAAGWTVVRCTWRQLRDDPATLRRNLLRILAQPKATSLDGTLVRP